MTQQARGSGRRSQAGGEAAGSSRQKAQSIAIRLLSSRERSESELRRRLLDKGFAEPDVEWVLDWLQAKGLQDDVRFATTKAQDAARSRGLSSRAIAADIRKWGVDPELAEAVAAEPPEAEEARARAIAVKRARQLRSFPPEVRRRRLAGYLGRRGYPASLCYSLAKELSDEPAADSETDF